MKNLYEGESLPFTESNIISLKGNFDKGSELRLENIIVSGLKKSVDSLFTPGFVNISSNNDSSLNAVIDYKIQNSNDEYGFPNIWVYSTQRTGMNRIPKAYLLGIDIDFDFDLKIPNTSLHYNFKEKAVPTGTIENFDDMSSGYAQMTYNTFWVFANKIADNFGLDKTF